MVRRQHRRFGHPALRPRGTAPLGAPRRGASLGETIAAVGIIIVLVAALAVPSFVSYARSRATADAAATLAEDIGLLERTAQNSNIGAGASLIIQSNDPLAYGCYVGRPASVDPTSTLGALIVQHSFSRVALTGGPISTLTPLLFARNGSAQYVDATGVVAPQHQTIEFVLGGRDSASTARVDLDLFSGAVSIR